MKKKKTVRADLKMHSEARFENVISFFDFLP